MMNASLINCVYPSCALLASVSRCNSDSDLASNGLVKR